MIYVGKYVNTHGIKGEIRIISNFSRKDLVFKVNNTIYIDSKEYKIKSYRTHKNYDMITLYDIENINQIKSLKGSNIYVLDIEDIFLIEDTINYKVFINNEKINIKELIENKKYKIIVLDSGKMIPFIDEFIEKIDKENKIIYIREGTGI